MGGVRRSSWPQVAGGAGVGVGAAALVGALWLLGVMPTVEQRLLDDWHVLRATQPVDDVVLLALDEETLARFPEPLVLWGPRFATAIQTARDHGVTVTGLDVLYKVSGESLFSYLGFDGAPQSRSWDASFRAQIARPDLVLVTSVVKDAQGVGRLDLPMPEHMFLLQPPEERLGLSDMPLTLGGVRSLTPAVQLDETHSLLGFPTLLAVRHLGLDPSAQKWLLGGREVARADGPIEIAFAGPPGTVPTIPLWRLIEPGALTAADRDLLDGRVAIIGAADPTSLDRVPVPYTLAGLAYGGDMYGAEVHAQALHTLLSGERVTRPDRLMSALIVLLAGLASGVAFAHSRFRAALLGLGVAALAWPAAGAAAFVGARIALPVASGLAASLFAFGGAYVLRYATEERERRRIRSLFERYVSDDVVEELLGSDAALQLGGTRREVTILFCDVVGFTSLSERLSAEEVVELVNVYLASMCAPILEHGGHVDKFAGDGIMAVFGAPALHPDHADRAVRAALAMSAAVPAVAAWVTERFADRELAPFDIGIGLHTGTPVAGNIGFERRTEYTVIGDDVNVAARIEGLTRTVGCRILASRHVVRAARDELPLGRRALLPVKGRREPVEVVELLAEPRETSP